MSIVEWDEDEVSGRQEPELEREANIFACCLLMPKKLIEQDMKNGFDLGNDDMVKQLAKKYDVPMNALIYRIYLLNNYKI
jgi:Zn-dependent peptidase ImmA (M78 family)